MIVADFRIDIAQRYLSSVKESFKRAQSRTIVAHGAAASVMSAAGNILACTINKREQVNRFVFSDSLLSLSFPTKRRFYKNSEFHKPNSFKDAIRYI